MPAVGQGPRYQELCAARASIGWALAHRGTTLAATKAVEGGIDVRGHVHARSAKIVAMLRRLLTLLLMLCLATGAAARGCPMALAAQAQAQAGVEASAHAAMPDCPHARAARAAQADNGHADSSKSGLGSSGCDHCKQCRVQVPPVEFLSLQPLPSPTHATGVQRSLLPSPFSAPNLRPPIASRPAHHA